MEAEWKGLKEGNGGRPLLDAKQRVGQMNIEVSVSRIRRRLEMDGLTQAGGDREEGREGRTEINGYILANCQVKFRQTFKMSQKSNTSLLFFIGLVKASYMVLKRNSAVKSVFLFTAEFLSL